MKAEFPEGDQIRARKGLGFSFLTLYIIILSKLSVIRFRIFCSLRRLGLKGGVKERRVAE
jgi:hypothetical protein